MTAAALPSALQGRMVALLARQAPAEGYNLTALPGVRLLRSNRPLARTPVLYDPGIVIVCQGRKQGFHGGERYVYDAQQYLVVAVPVPFTMESEGSEAEPLLALYLHLDFTLAAELALALDEQGAAMPPELRSMVSSPMDVPMADAVLRLLDALADPLEAAVLAPARLRELYFRVLTGPQGGVLRAALTQQGRFGQIGRAIRHMHAAHAERLDVTQLARLAGMSAPSFHAHFKQVTGEPPMQYLKSLRLHQARLLMAQQGMTAAAASARVGYESASQFGREFKRLFGTSPTVEVARMKASFAVPPAQAASVYVASH